MVAGLEEYWGLKGRDHKRGYPGAMRSLERPPLLATPPITTDYSAFEAAAQIQ